MKTTTKPTAMDVTTWLPPLYAAQAQAYVATPTS